MIKKNESKHNFEVSNVHEWNNGGVTFNLTIDDFITIYGCRLVEGRNGLFIGFPSRKSENDGKYYSHAYAKLTNYEQQLIIDKVANMQ